MTRNASFPGDTDQTPASTERVDHCLFCHGLNGETVLEDVQDYFFNCLPLASTFMRCADCESLWIPDRLTADELPRAYARYYTHVPGGDAPAEAGVRSWLKGCYAAVRFGGSHRLQDKVGAALCRVLARNRVELDAAYRFALTGPGRLLDYGCGSGDYLRRMQALGHNVAGVDFDPVAVGRVRESGIEAYTPEQAEELDWAGQFDAITIAHVIEHVPDPVSLLKKLHSWLRPGGVLFIEAPNAAAWGLQAFGRYWRGLEAPRHLGIPSMRGLDLALRESGLTAQKQVVRQSVRQWLWAESLAAVPEESRAEVRQALTQAPPEDASNAEFLTIVARAAN